jgi:hypothetical protein
MLLKRKFSSIGTRVVLRSVGAWPDALAGVSERVVVCGHTHLQFDRSFAGIRVVSRGGVGAPTVRPVAWWAVLGPGVELRTTEYDIDATIEAARAEVGVPHLRGFEYWLRDTPTYEQRVAALKS